jgi:hypothetical protein
LVFDEIVIGSGLAAIGTVLGLPPARRVLVIDASAAPRSLFYDAAGGVPCAHLGRGGLGNFWHGVIPTGRHVDFTGATAERFAGLFARFFPGTDVEGRIGQPWLFVPARPIRPETTWRRLVSERGAALQFSTARAEYIALTGAGVKISTEDGSHEAGRVWVCAGALHTPALLGRSFDASLHRSLVSDHAIVYLGLIDRDQHPNVEPPRVERTRGGIWIPCRYGTGDASLCTLRPARFAFRHLDRGIEQRAVFGLPMGNALTKILRRASPGLVSEALYNKAGLFPHTRYYSVYAQVSVDDAYELGRHGALRPHAGQIRAATDRARANPPWAELLASRRPDVYIPGIHLHGSLSAEALRRTGLNEEGSPVQVMDASLQARIGPEHHSFKIMLAASEQARSRS